MASIFTEYAKDQFMAPGMSRFTIADIPDMSSHCDQSSHWISNFTLNSMLRFRYGESARQYAFNFLRRAESAFLEHDRARKATLQFLSGQDDFSMYMRAIYHWECFLAQTWQAQLLLAGFRGLNWKQDIFKKGQGSVEERLNGLYNCTKHAESTIVSRQLPATATIPVWLTNDGLKSLAETLTFAESGEILSCIAQRAQDVSNPKSGSDA